MSNLDDNKTFIMSIDGNNISFIIIRFGVIATLDLTELPNVNIFEIVDALFDLISRHYELITDAAIGA